VAICDPRDFISTNLNLLVLRFSMPKINALRPVVHEKKIFKGFWYINLVYKNYVPLRA